MGGLIQALRWLEWGSSSNVVLLSVFIVEIRLLQLKLETAVTSSVIRTEVTFAFW